MIRYKKVVMLQPFRRYFISLCVNQYFCGCMTYLNIKKALADMKEVTGICIATIQKLLDQLIQKSEQEATELLASCYKTALYIAKDKGIKRLLSLALVVACMAIRRQIQQRWL